MSIEKFIVTKSFWSDCANAPRWGRKGLELSRYSFALYHDLSVTSFSGKQNLHTRCCSNMFLFCFYNAFFTLQHWMGSLQWDESPFHPFTGKSNKWDPAARRARTGYLPDADLPQLHMSISSRTVCLTITQSPFGIITWGSTAWLCQVLTTGQKKTPNCFGTHKETHQGTLARAPGYSLKISCLYLLKKERLNLSEFAKSEESCRAEG